MLPEEILAIPDFIEAELLNSIAASLDTIRDQISQIRQVRQINLQEDTPLGQEARKVNSIAMAIFGFR